MGLPEVKKFIKRVYFQCRLQPEIIAWLRTKAAERNMYVGEFCEAVFTPLMEKEKCAKKKPTSTRRSKSS